MHCSAKDFVLRVRQQESSRVVVVLKRSSSDCDIPVPGNGGYTDWRLPNYFELATIKDSSAPGCGTPPLACIDAISTPTIAGGYWSSTAHTATHVWWVHFGDPGSVGLNAKDTFLSVRPVRTAF